MKIEQIGDPEHRGSETYAVDFVITTDDATFDTLGEHVNYVMRPESIRLVWVRHFGTPWKRVTSFGGCKIVGSRVRGNGRVGTRSAYKHVYLGSGAEPDSLTTYAKSLPGLEEKINEIEANLPE